MLIDFHSHILPGIDDGSQSVADSIAMLRMEARQGISHVVATPHFIPHRDKPQHFLQRRAEAERILRREMEKHDDLPQLYVGAEVFYFRGISESEFLPQLTIQGGRGVLIEMPPAPWPESTYEELEAIWSKRGITPVIAHIDRYIGPFRTHGIPRRFMHLPVLVQANADFFLERPTANMALRMMKKGQIHLLGSDCHGISSRKPNLGEVIPILKNKLGEEAVFGIRQYERMLLQL